MLAGPPDGDDEWSIVLYGLPSSTTSAENAVFSSALASLLPGLSSSDVSLVSASSTCKIVDE